MKTVQSEKDLLIGNEYSDDCIRILIYCGKYGINYKFNQQNWKFSRAKNRDILISVTPVYLDKEQIKKLKYYD